MAIQPTYHWQFNEREGTVTKDINGVEAKLVRCTLQLHGRIGNAIKLNGKNSALYLGKEAGQFGTNDFTIAFGMVVLGRNDQNDLDIIGTRSSKSHGNWVSLLLLDKKRLSFEVDEDSNGTNFFTIETGDTIPDHSWHHVALVREGLTLRIYVDGELQAEGDAPSIANIHNDADMKVGDWLRDTATARYEDLRIYHNIALSSEEIQNLATPVNRFLRPGQIELVAFDNAALILSEDETDLTRYSTQFQSLRLGENTGVTLYRGNNFESASQKLYADVPEIRHTKLDAFPKSIQIWSSIGAPFTGKWIISAGNGQYLNQNKQMLETSQQHVTNAFFSFQYNPHTYQTLLVPANNVDMPLLKVGDNKASILIVDDSEFEEAAFSIAHSSGTHWLKLDGTLSWTDQRSERTLFYRVMKIADSEEQVGEITEGEVALYQHISYHGKVWVLSDFEPGVQGNFGSLKGFQGLDNTISSIRLGPDTGVTLFANEQQQVDAGKEEIQQEDIFDNVPDMRETQIANDNVSSLKIFRIVRPETLFTSVTSKLSQDYRLVDDVDDEVLEEFSSYRTILRLNPEITEVEVSATDLTTIEVDGTLHTIDERRSVKLSANLLRQIMITSEADGLSTPGLKIRTNNMVANQFVVIFPDQEAHQQIAELEDDALWNATDKDGNLIVDQNQHSRSDVASVQNTIKRAMATVVNTPDTPDESDAAPVPVSVSNLRSVSGFSNVVSTKQFVSVETIDNPWTLNLQPRPITGTIPGGSAGLVMASPNIWEEPVDQNSFEQLIAQSELAVEPVTIDGAGVIDGTFAALSIGGLFDNIRDAIKNAAKVTLGVLDGAFNALVEIGGKIVRFVLNTAKKVADFVEAVVNKVVKSIKQFIEFLQFIFDWDDILETKRFLVNTFNSALNAAGDMVESAKKPVSEFFDTLQEGLDDGIDGFIDLVGFDPEKDQNKGFELPEAAEWFLNKLIGGSGKSLIEEATDTISHELSDVLEDLTGLELPPLVTTFLGILEKIQNLPEIAKGIKNEVVVEIVETLIANPLKPQLLVVGVLEALRTVGTEILVTTENIALTFLDLVVEAFDSLRDLLNAEINIPLISALFKMIGGGDLTILNLTGMLVAIPATILSKLLFGEAPFKDIPQPAFPGQASTAALRSFSAQADGEEDQEDKAIDFENQRRKVIGFGVIAITADLLNGMITTMLDMIPEMFDEFIGDATAPYETMSLVLSGFSWLASFPASAVEAGGYPYDLLASENRVNRSGDDTGPEFWERIMWGWRTFTLGFDILYMGVAGAATFFNPDSLKIRKYLPKQRLRRGTKYTDALLFAFTLVDMGLTVRTLVAIPKDDKDKFGREITNELMGFLPPLCSWMRMTPVPYLWLGLFGINVTSTAITTGLNIAILKDDAQALKKKDQAQQVTI